MPKLGKEDTDMVSLLKSECLGHRDSINELSSIKEKPDEEEDISIKKSLLVQEAERHQE